MKAKYVIAVILTMFMLGVTSACQVTPSPEPPPGAAPCVGFREYVIGHTFTNPWELIGFIFTGNNALVIDGVNNINGLKIEPAGLRVELPEVTENVTIQAMAWGTMPLKIDALDSYKTYVDQVLVPDDDTLHTVYLSAEEISTVIFTEGDNEAFLIEICMGDFYR